MVLHIKMDKLKVDIFNKKLSKIYVFLDNILLTLTFAPLAV